MIAVSKSLRTLTPRCVAVGSLGKIVFVLLRLDVDVLGVSLSLETGAACVGAEEDVDDDETDDEEAETEEEVDF